VTLQQYLSLLPEHERDWIERLQAHAADTGHPVETVLAEALIERHREAAELETANTNMRATITRLSTK